MPACCGCGPPTEHVSEAEYVEAHMAKFMLPYHAIDEKVLADRQRKLDRGRTDPSGEVLPYSVPRDPDGLMGAKKAVLDRGNKLRRRRLRDARADRFTILKLLAAKGCSLDTPHLNGITPLYAACELGLVEFVKALVEAGADLEKAADDGSTPLFVVVSSPLPVRYHLTNYLVIAGGANVDARRANGGSPLHTAAARGDTDMIALLLDLEANINARNHGRWTPLFAAVEANQKAAVALLLERGANRFLRDSHGCSAVDIAETAGNAGIADMLKGAVALPKVAVSADGTIDQSMQPADCRVERGEANAKAGGSRCAVM